MSQLQDMGRQVINNNEKAADTIYQRKPGGPEMIAPVLKLLVTFTELLVQSGKADAEHAVQMQRWQTDFTRLAEANEKGDLILAADILHHDINPEIEDWMKQ
ncbi:hypothetical protein [Butyrivibrio sp. INlla16]|uniref:hypothetical protein n=1 Tax=Butyrivibrio sp. INlla16 TaxID=1520807 RepID=UPI00088CDC63|nr:hypothetical protein [Butyrivibrio sp. INlla16]SDB60034.1 hypothetical protein SAMN02910263_03134 [Butyrivibrio sp. INlla16]